MGSHPVDLFGPMFFNGFRRLAHGACGIYHIVQDNGHFPFHIPYHMHDLAFVGPETPFVYDGNAGRKPFGIGPGALYSSGIRGNNYQLLVPKGIPKVIQEDWGGKEVIYRNIKKPLNLAGMKIHAKHPPGPGNRKEVSHQLGGNRGPGGGFAILTGITIIGYYRGNTPGRGPS